MNQTALFLLIVHFLSDFIFQTKDLAEKKNKNMKLLTLHSIIYLVLSTLILGLYGKWYLVLIYGFTLGFSHFLIDHIKIIITKKIKDKKYIFTIFLIDQLLHILCILIISRMFNNLNSIGLFIENNIILPLLDNRIDTTSLLKYILAFIFVLQPASVIVRIFLQSFSVEEESIQNAEDSLPKNKAGSAIGKLERVIVLIFGLMGQYASIALVLTAKSIARFNKISTDADFAERYLLGTLLSLLLVVIALLVVKF